MVSRSEGSVTATATVLPFRETGTARYRLATCRGTAEMTASSSLRAAQADELGAEMSGLCLAHVGLGDQFAVEEQPHGALAGGLGLGANRRDLIGVEHAHLNQRLN